MSKTRSGFLAQCRRNLSFPDHILWTDEATFTPNSVFNSHNFMIWEDENPHAVRSCTFQYRWLINVWAGVFVNRVVNISMDFQIGPYFLQAYLNGRTYAYIIENQLQHLLEDIPLRERETLIFQHELPHITLEE